MLFLYSCYFKGNQAIKKNYIPFFFCSVQVQKKPDKQNEELLSDGSEENDSGFWTSLTRLVGLDEPLCVFSTTPARRSLSSP